MTTAVDRSLLATHAAVFEVDGEVRGELSRDLLRLEIEESTAGLKTLCARFLAFGPEAAQGGRAEELLYLDGRTLDFGRQLSVSLGPAGGQRILFEGRISALQACFEEGQEPEVVIHAEDRLMDLRMCRRSRTYENLSDAQIAEEIAGLHGLEASADAEGPTYAEVQQSNVSDLAFLRDRARLLQAELWLERGTLHFQQRPRRAGSELELVQGNHLLSVTLGADLAHQRTVVRCTGYDAQSRSVLDESAGNEAVVAELGRGRSGPQILDQAFGPRPYLRSQEVPLVAEEAAAWARAEMLRRARGFVQVCATARGLPDLRVGSRLQLSRVGQPFEGGGYAVTRARHTYDLAAGYRTNFDAERAFVEAAT